VNQFGHTISWHNHELGSGKCYSTTVQMSMFCILTTYNLNGYHRLDDGSAGDPQN